MKKIIIHGGAKLEGEVNISGSKNSVVALIPAAILAQDKVKLYNYPKIADVEVLIEILNELNVHVNVTEDYLEIDSTQIKNIPLVSENISKLRASYYFIGSLLAMFNEVNIAMPGGCYLGPRPIDLHLKGFKKLNSHVVLDEGMLHIKTEHLIGNKIFLDIPSVGATINIMLASIFVKGETLIENAAKEPEIIDIANFLNQMGASIEGAGTSLIKINGVKKLHGTDYVVMVDRIEAGTYLLYGAACGKEVVINHITPNYIQALVSKLIECNVPIKMDDKKMIIKQSSNLMPTNIKTAVYPGFPTDLQQIFTALMTQANGTSLIQETIYQARFKNCDDLVKMGATIHVDSNSAIIYGPSPLTGTDVYASDLRGGASLILAALVADHVTKIGEVEHIFRGYSNIVQNLKRLGVNIKINE
jgi:UDP-N-acetylglucosamine 1-carboxyvinyltransferase